MQSQPPPANIHDLDGSILLGKINYAMSNYAKLVRATIPIADENSRLYYVLLLSFDRETGQGVHEIIMEKIIPLVRKNTDKFLKDA